MRHTGSYGKTEFGVTPSYKGPVASSGLSKDRWIEGMRHVRHLPMTAHWGLCWSSVIQLIRRMH